MGTERPTATDGTVDLNAETVESTIEASTVPLSEETAPTPHLMLLLYSPDTPKKLSDKFPRSRITKDAGGTVLMGRNDKLDVLLNDEHMPRTFMELWCENQPVNGASDTGNHDGPAWFVKNKSSKKLIRVYKHSAQQTGFGPRSRELNSLNGQAQSVKLKAEEQLCLQNGCELKLEGLTFIVVIEEGDENTRRFDVEVRPQGERPAVLNRQFSCSTSSGSGHSDLSVESASGLAHRPACRNSSGSLTSSSGTSCSCGGACPCSRQSQAFLGTPQQCPGGVHNLAHGVAGLSLNGSYGNEGMQSRGSASSCPSCGHSSAPTLHHSAPQPQALQPVIICMSPGATAFQSAGAGPPPMMHSAPPPYSVVSQSSSLAAGASHTLVQTNSQPQMTTSTGVKQQYESAAPPYQQPYGFQGRMPQPQGQIHQVQGHVPQAQSHLPQPQGQASLFQGQMPHHQGQVMQPQGQMLQLQGQTTQSQGQMIQSQGQVPHLQGQIQQVQGHLLPPFQSFQDACSHQGVLPQERHPSHGTLPSQGLLITQGMSAQSGNATNVHSQSTDAVTQSGNVEALAVQSANAILQSADVITQSGNGEVLPALPSGSVGNTSAFPELSSAQLRANSLYQQSFTHPQGQQYSGLPPSQPYMGGMNQSQSRLVIEPLHGPQSMPVCEASGIPQQARFAQQPQPSYADQGRGLSQAPQQITHQESHQPSGQGAVQFPVQPQSSTYQGQGQHQGQQVASGQAVTSTQPSVQSAVRFPVQPESAMYQSHGQQVASGQLVTSVCQGQAQGVQHSGQSHPSYGSDRQPFVTNPTTMDPNPRVCTAGTVVHTQGFGSSMASSGFHGHVSYLYPVGGDALPVAPPVAQLNSQRFPTQVTSQTPATSLSVARADSGFQARDVNAYPAACQAGLYVGQSVPVPSGAQAGTFPTQTGSSHTGYLPHTTDAQTGVEANSVSRSAAVTAASHSAEGAYAVSSVAHGGSSVQAVVPQSSMLRPSSNGNTVNLRVADDIAPTPPPSSDFITLSSVGVHDLQAENRGRAEAQRRREPEEDDERSPTEHEDES